MKYCQTCGKVTDDDNIVCPDPACRGHLENSPPLKSTISSDEIDTIVKKVWNRTWKRHVYLITGEFSLIMILGLFGLIDIYHKASNAVQERIVTKIDGEFKTERIRATISGVAADRASQILEHEVHPAVAKLTNDIAVFSAKIEDLSKTKDQQEVQIAALNHDLRNSQTIESNLNNTLTEARNALKKLDEQSEFVTTVILADHDDREAFWKLYDWAWVSQSRFKIESQEIFHRIQGGYLDYVGPYSAIEWDQIPGATNRNNWKLDDIVNCWNHIRPASARAFMDFVQGQTNLTKEEQLSFLRHVYLKDSHNSLYAQTTAAYDAAAMLNANYNPVFIFTDIEEKFAAFSSTNHLFTLDTNLPTDTIYDIIPSADTNRVKIIRRWTNTICLEFKLKASPVPGTLKGKWLNHSFGGTQDFSTGTPIKNICVGFANDIDLTDGKFEFRYQQDSSNSNAKDVALTNNLLVVDQSFAIPIPGP